MAKAGDRMVADATGETFVFLKTAADTDGRLLQIQMIIAPGGGAKGAPAHVHPKQKEHFHVQKGEILMWVNGKEQVYRAGESVTISPGVPHTWRNSTDEELQFLLEFEPALEWEFLFETLSTLSREGKLAENGRVKPLMLALALHTYKNHMYVAGIPILIQKGLFALLAPIARLAGYKPYYPYFAESAEVKQVMQHV